MDAKTLGAFVARRRGEKGMTQAELAERLNVTDKAVSRWERGIGLPDINTIEPLASVLDVSLPELIHCKKAMDDEEEEKFEFYVTETYFEPHDVYVRKKAIPTLPLAMQEHIREGKKVGAIKELKGGKLLIATSRKPDAITAVVDADDVSAKIRRMRECDIPYLPEPIRSHVMNGGSLYEIGTPKNGKVIISTTPELDGYIMEDEYRTLAEKFGTDYPYIVGAMKRRIKEIKNEDLSISERRTSASHLRNCLIYCTTLKELDNLTAIYRDEVDEELVTKYKPRAIMEFVDKLDERYPKKITIVDRCLSHRDRIYAEIGAVLKECIDVIESGTDEDETKKAAKLLHMHLDDCRGRRGMDELTAVYRNKKENSEVGYDYGTVLQFVDDLTARYPIPVTDEQTVHI